MHAIASKKTVRYVFDHRPGTGDVTLVAPGVHWLRMSLPFALSHINLWLLEDEDCWTIVDTGVGMDECKDIWRRTFAGAMQDRPVNRVLVTHLHPDHIGCAGWIAAKFDAPLWMTREEYLLARILVADTGRPAPDVGDRFYHAAGFAPDQLNHYHKMFGFFGKFVVPLPEAYRRIQHGDRIVIGDYEWQVVVGNGHSPEHACLYEPKQNVLISGDQLLPTISSNVSVFPTEPHANPLADWLDSLARLKDAVPDDVLVLPAHGSPFQGAHERLDELIAEHVEALDKLEAFCQQPRRAIDVFEVLFKSKISEKNLIMATGESVAHLNFLLESGRLISASDKHGVHWYERT